MSASDMNPASEGSNARARSLDPAASEVRWLTVDQASARAQVGVKTVYREVRAGRLRAARVGGRRELRLLAAWVDEWLLASSEPVEVRR